MADALSAHHQLSLTPVLVKVKADIHAGLGSGHGQIKRFLGAPSHAICCLTDLLLMFHPSCVTHEANPTAQHLKTRKPYSVCNIIRKAAFSSRGMAKFHGYV